MNKDNLLQIFSHYIDKFDYINNAENHENYKWLVCRKFKKLMDEALSKEGVDFAPALYKAKAVTENIIDSYTQPFAGLVEFAKREPDTVKEMFLKLYSDDGGDIHVQEKLIEEFFNKSNELLDKYFPGSFRYKQNSHSVSAYLFLYAPDNHYMFKASQSSIFADCIEFYDDWGTGDNIKLDVYYRMCDWLVEQILSCKELLATDLSRFDLPEAKEMFEDKNKHLLAFDIIYCCSVYDLFDGIAFSRPNMKEKNLVLEKRNTALIKLENYNIASDNLVKLNEALKVVAELMQSGLKISHQKFGEGLLLNYTEGIVEVAFGGAVGVKKLGVYVIFSSGLAKLEDIDIETKLMQVIPYLKDKETKKIAVERAKKELEDFKEYLE